MMLKLGKNNVGDSGAIAIANKFEHLTYLNLSRNPISEETKEIVRKKLKSVKVAI